MQEPALPYRVARSARDLVSATLSGGFELKDVEAVSMGGKLAGNSTQHLPESASRHATSLQSRRAVDHHTNGFREATNAARSKEAGEGFRHFQEHDDSKSRLEQCSDSMVARDLPVRPKNPRIPTPEDHIALENVGLGLDSLPDTSKTTAQEYQQALMLLEQRRKRYLAGPRRQRELDLLEQEGTSRSQHDSQKRLDTSAKEDVEEMLDLDGSSSLSSTIESTKASVVDQTMSNLAHEAAFRRLQQLEAHLQRNLAVHNMYETSQFLAYDVESRLQQERVYRAAAEHQDHISSNQTRSDLVSSHEHTSSLHDGTTGTAPRLGSLPEEEMGELQRHFHCPYYACHQNLHHASSSSNSGSCVHAGCEFQNLVKDSWLQHICLPHHDLLGSASMEQW